MEMVYSTQKRDFEPGRRYANPKFFDHVRREASRVTVIGDYPHIVKAYRDAGVKVVILKPGQPLPKLMPTKAPQGPATDLSGHPPPKTHPATEPNAPESPQQPEHNGQEDTSEHGTPTPGEGDGLDYAGAAAPIGGTADWRAEREARERRDEETTGRTGGQDAEAEIPGNWRNLHWSKQKQLADVLSGRKAANGAEAVEVIEGVLISRRGGAVRVSSRESDAVGYQAWGELTHGGDKSLDIYLNGKPIEDVVAADEAEGWVELKDGDTVSRRSGRVFVDVV